MYVCACVCMCAHVGVGELISFQTVEANFLIFAGIAQGDIMNDWGKFG